jgi:putative DNA primase/helicase
LLDGDPDLGKSVVTMDIAARGSMGRDLLDGAPCEAGNVLVVNVEDGIEDTIVPRLKAHGADLNRVFILSSIPDGNGGTRLLDLPRDIALLENKVLQRKAKLLIIDPVLTMLGGDANKDQDARKALTPIAEMAERTGAAIVGVRHLKQVHRPQSHPAGRRQHGPYRGSACGFVLC